MSRVFRSSLLLGVAVLSLAACSSTKGPGELGSKDDIVVRNNGMPQAKQQAADAAPATTQGGDFSSTVEQGEAVPAAEVAAAEPLPDNSPAMEAAVKAQEEANAPLPSTATDEATNSAIPADPNTNPIDAVAPTTPVTESIEPPPVADAATAAEPTPAVIPPSPSAAPSAVDYPAAVDQATQVPAPAAAPAPYTPGPSAVPAGVKYPLDPNAPYSPKAVAEAAAAANVETSAAPATSAAAPMPTTANINDPAVVRAAQAALKAKGAYNGAETGEVDAGFLNALILYQGKNNLPQGGLNEATLKQLGVFQ